MGWDPLKQLEKAITNPVEFTQKNWEKTETDLENLAGDTVTGKDDRLTKVAEVAVKTGLVYSVGPFAGPVWDGLAGKDPPQRTRFDLPRTDRAYAGGPGVISRTHGAQAPKSAGGAARSNFDSNRVDWGGIVLLVASCAAMIWGLKNGT